jgi:hypothetical protein
MGFGKAKYDVEEKGLDPRVGHKALAADGRLDTLQQPLPVTLTREEAEQKYLALLKRTADLEPKDGLFASPFSDEEYQFVKKTAWEMTKRAALDLADDSIVPIQDEDDGTEITLPVVATEPIEVLEGENIDQIQAAKAVWAEAAHAEVVKQLEAAKEEAISEVDGFAPNAETSFVMEKALEEFRAETAVDEEQVKSNQEDIEYVQKILFKDLPQEEPEATPVTPKKAPAKKKTTKK